ncbi:MAG: GtrA family protein [Patescibacteria group bacterium]
MYKKILQYAVSGGTAFIMDFAVLYALFAYTHLSYFYAVPLAFIFGTLVNYSINHLWVFKGNTQSVAKGYWYFLQIALIGIIATLGIMTIMIEWLHINTLFSRVVAAGLVFIWSFAANYFLNFIFNAL